MIKFNKLDFQLCQIPEHLRIVYVFVRNNETYLTFDYQYLQTILKDCTDVYVKKLQSTNLLKVPFNKKRIIDANKKLFKLENKL